ncbi:hypothetical protein D1614_00770 [Maribellus luteus]|uniref:Uncharacterized protein n=1 Tax=Maribellus luteus TaxID=2305463 RepID=A0A399T8K8_9BACT|nr:hypothetical protein [Maribellus luteus]RIJ50501.1 hypothetical protein D1614_00770 [Maribellus luteus]
MKQSFTHILTVQFDHSYFHDNKFKPIQISYEAPTSQLLKNYEIIIKPFPGGFHLLTTDPDLLQSDNESASLKFRFTCSDAYFINYSDLPRFDLRNHLFYFNNLAPHLETPDTLFLHAEKYVSINDIVVITSQTIQTKEKEGEVSFQDVRGTPLAPWRSNQSPPGTAYQFTDLPEGVIRMRLKSNEEHKVYYTGEAMWKKPLGILEIFPDELHKQFAKNGKINYVIQFNNRSTVWKYFIVNPVYQKFQNLAIINKKKEQVFNDPQKQTLHENTEAWVFESKEKLPIAELQDDSFQLIEAEEPTLKKGRIVIKRLRNASPDFIYNDEKQLTEIQYSHIYI